MSLLIHLLSKLEHIFAFYVSEKHENPSFNTKKNLYFSVVSTYREFWN